jgi:hypothetical protein
MTDVNKKDAFDRLKKSIEFYRNALQNMAEFSKTDKRSKPQLMKRLATLEKEAGEARPASATKARVKPLMALSGVEGP